MLPHYFTVRDQVILHLPAGPWRTEARGQRFAYLKLVCLLIVAVVVVVCEGGPPDQGGDLWTGKEFERGPKKAAFESHLHPQSHGQQLLAFPALLRLPNNSTLFLIFQPQFLREHIVPCRAREAPAVRFGEPRLMADVRQQIRGSCLCPVCRGLRHVTWKGRLE